MKSNERKLEWDVGEVIDYDYKVKHPKDKNLEIY